MPGTRALALVMAVGIGGLSSCKKETESTDAARPADSAASRAKAIDPDLAEALGAASAGIVPGSAPAPAASGGPPANGIFAPGLADKEIRAGEPPKLTLGSEGSEPRVLLSPAQPKPGARQNLTLKLSVQNAPNQGALPLDIGLALEAHKPKGDEGHVNEVPVTARVTSARLGIAGAPADVAASIAKLKGAKVEYLVLPDGAGTAFRYDIPKGAGEELSDIVRALSDTLAVITLPYPDKAVGVGGFWMATSRDVVIGLDVVTYRLVKVESAQPDNVTLSVNTKRYATSPAFDIPGLPPDAPRTMIEFQALAQGTLSVAPGSGFPKGGRQESVLGATLGTGQTPSGTLEIRTRAELTAEAPTR